MLNLFKNGRLIRQVRPGSALSLDGVYVCPADDGWSFGDYKLVEAPPAPDPEPPTPEDIRAGLPALYPRQFRDALIDNGISPDAVTAAINQIPFDIRRHKALNAWEYPTMFERVDPYIDMIGAMFDLTPEQIDAMWEQALSI